MSWKSVELQIALPRSLEQSRNQQIQQHQSQLQNMADAEQLAAKGLAEEQTVIETADTARSQIRDRQQGGQRGGRERSPQGDSHEEAADFSEANLHPYKGHRLDIKM